MPAARHFPELRSFQAGFQLVSAFLLSLAIMGGALLPGAAVAQDQGLTPEREIGVIEAPESTGGAYESAPADSSAEATANDGFSLAPRRTPRSNDEAERRASRVMGIPVVIELFTAQGCSTCPTADHLIATLADQPDVLTLSWHVDYWDYLGWADGFANPESTVRQEHYAAAAGERGVYTPQIVVDGQDTLIGVSRAGLLALIDEHASRPPAVIVTASAVDGGHVIDLTPRAAVPGGVELTMIRYLPHREVTIDAGENRGQTMVYRNIVVGVETLSRWPARTPMRLTVRAGGDSAGEYPADTRHALLVQQSLGDNRQGPILAAVRLD